MEYKRKLGVKADMKNFDPSTWKNRVAIDCNGEDQGRPKSWTWDMAGLPLDIQVETSSRQWLCKSGVQRRNWRNWNSGIKVGLEP